MDFAQWLKHLRTAKDLTMQQVGDALGITRASISNWESGLTSPAKGKLPALARLYGVPIERLLMGNLKPSNVITVTQTTAPADSERGQVPYLTPAQIEPWIQGRHQQAKGWMYCPVDVGPRGFVSRMQGVSMMPRFDDGDFLFVDPALPIVHGAFVLIVSDGEPPLAREVQVEDRLTLLRAINPDWPGNRLHKLAPKSRIAGVIVGNWRPT